MKISKARLFEIRRKMFIYSYRPIKYNYDHLSNTEKTLFTKEEFDEMANIFVLV